MKIMYNTIIKNIDILNVVFAIVATVALLMNDADILQACIILVATITLLATKYQFNRVFIFLTYTSSTFFFAFLYAKTVTDYTENTQHLIIVIAVSLLVGIIGATLKLGSNTLSFVWITMHILIFITAFQMTSHTVFIKALWSSNTQFYTISQYYPYLLAGFLIGVFLEKYQVAIKKDRRDD